MFLSEYIEYKKRVVYQPAWKKLLKQEELEETLRVKPKKDHSKIKNAFDRCNMLFQKSIAKNELRKMIQDKKKELDGLQELVGCTFSPKLNKGILSGVSNYKVVEHKTTIYERTIIKQKAKMKKVKELELEEKKLNQQIHVTRFYIYFYFN